MVLLEDLLFEADERPIRRPTRIVVDLSKVKFFDSTLISALVHGHLKTQREGDGALAVVVDSPECFAARVLKSCGVTSVIPTFTTRTSAVAALAGDAATPPSS